MVAMKVTSEPLVASKRPAFFHTETKISWTASSASVPERHIRRASDQTSAP